MKRFFKMNHILLSTLLLCFYDRFNIDCVLLDDLSNWVWGSGSWEQVSNEISLILVVEKNGRTYLANNQFVAIRMNQHYEKFFFLCPAETDEDGEINNSSKTKNVLFIKKIHQNVDNENDTKNDVVYHTCVNPVRPSVIEIGCFKSDSNIKLYSVGYEVYFASDAEYYYTDDYYHRVGLEDKRFAWFNIYTIAFNKLEESVVSVFSHSLAYRNNKMKLPPEMGLDYSLGKKELFGETDIATFYNKDHQENVFKELYKCLLYMPFYYLDQIQDRYLVPIHLAHLDSFGIPLLRQAGMTYANMGPMWNMVYNHAWLKIEKNLDALAQGLNAIHIVTGVYGILEFSGIPFYLRSNETIKVPAAFFKIVSYSPNNEEKFNMVIVTNNNPYVENDRTNEEICKQNECKHFGWDSIQQDAYFLGRTSCCQLTDEVLIKLKLQDYSNLVDKALDLKKVPHWRNLRLTLNMKAYIQDQMNDVVNDKRSDSVIYKNEDLPTFLETEEITFGKFITTLHKNYVSPYFVFFDNPEDETKVE